MASKLSDSNCHLLTSRAVADAASWYCAFVLVALILLGLLRESSTIANNPIEFKGSQFLERPCDEIYVVGEGETLHTISDKCGDPFIVERNPHIHDPDDVFPGLVIKITPSQPRKFSRKAKTRDEKTENRVGPGRHCIPGPGDSCSLRIG